MNEFAAEHLQVLPDPAARLRRDLPGLEDAELLALTSSLPRSSQVRAAALDLLVARYGKLVRSFVQRYSRSSVSAQDLTQVGYVGLLKAINNFDPALGFSLAAYAEPCITGEIKRHFRDRIWQVRVGRPLQERVLEVREAEQRLTHDLGRVPADSELAGDLRISAADVREARQAELVLRRCFWMRRCAGSLTRPTWLIVSVRKRPDSSTSSACRRSLRTGPSCPRGSSKSWCCITTAA
jgi:RNA polymerase sigma factor (sigma-70 family)